MSRIIAYRDSIIKNNNTLCLAPRVESVLYDKTYYNNNSMSSIAVTGIRLVYGFYRSRICTILKTRRGTYYYSQLVYVFIRNVFIQRVN